MLPTAGKEFDILSHFEAALGQFNIRLTVKKNGVLCINLNIFDFILAFKQLQKYTHIRHISRI